MTLYTDNLPPRVNQTWEMIRRFSKQERLLLAKALLDSVIAPTTDSALDEDSDWQHLSLTSFTADWDNADDAIYDNWREHYNV